MANRMPRRVLDALKRARESATLDNASFGMPTSMVQATQGVGYSEPEHIDEFIRRKTKIYRETWVIPQLDIVIAWAEGKE